MQNWDQEDLAYADLEEGSEGPPPPPLSEEFFKRFNDEKNAEMNVQMPFSGPFFPELGSRLPLF